MKNVRADIINLAIMPPPEVLVVSPAFVLVALRQDALMEERLAVLKNALLSPSPLRHGGHLNPDLNEVC